MVSGSLSLTEMWPTFALRGMPTSFISTRWRIRGPAPIRLRRWASLNPTASYASWRDRWACEAQDFKSVHVNNCASGVVCESGHGFSPYYVPRPRGTAQEAAEKRYSGPRKGGAEKPALSERATTLFP